MIIACVSERRSFTCYCYPDTISASLHKSYLCEKYIKVRKKKMYLIPSHLAAQNVLFVVCVCTL